MLDPFAPQRQCQSVDLLDVPALLGLQSESTQLVRHGLCCKHEQALWGAACAAVEELSTRVAGSSYKSGERSQHRRTAHNGLLQWRWSVG